jgi:glycosyltransferase involved in cell wall biosynthesis
MNDGYLVSIVVRTQGKRPQLLASALRSLAQQTHRRLEVIVVEDGATSSAPVVTAANLARGGVFRHLPIAKRGRCEAGNAGLTTARGDYLGFLDEDDWLEPEHVATLVAALLTQPDAELAYARARPILSEGLTEDVVVDTGELPLEGDVPFSRTLLWLRNAIPIQAALFRRSLYERHGGIDVALDALEDWDLWLRYSSDNDFIAVDAITSSYRLPASVAEREVRGLTHEASREKLLAKHAGLTGTHRFADIASLPGAIREQTSLRDALKRARTALSEKVFGAGRKPPS